MNTPKLQARIEELERARAARARPAPAAPKLCARHSAIADRTALCTCPVAAIDAALAAQAKP